MKDTCFGAIKEAKFDQLLEKCDDIRIKTLENEVKRVSKNTWVLFSKEESKFQAQCLSKKVQNLPVVEEIPFKGFMKMRNCAIGSSSNVKGSKLVYSATDCKEDACNHGNVISWSKL